MIIKQNSNISFVSGTQVTYVNYDKITNTVVGEKQTSRGICQTDSSKHKLNNSFICAARCYKCGDNECDVAQAWKLQPARCQLIL